MRPEIPIRLQNPRGGGSVTKVYYVFGTQAAQAKSYDLINWTPFENNLSSGENLMEIIPDDVKTYTGNTEATQLKENCWAPDVIYNTSMGKWCMYLSVNGATYNSAIVLLVADQLDGTWSYMGEVVYSGMGISGNDTSLTDFQEVTGKAPDAKYSAMRSGNAIYNMNAIDACITYDGDDLWMTYGSFFGGIFMLKIDPTTGLRDKDVTYATNIVYADGSTMVADGQSYTVYSDEYFGIHIAGGHGQTGEGSYIEKIGDYYYLFMSYGAYAPEGDYNMRVFRSSTITGYANNDFSSEANFVGYRDSGNSTAMVQNSVISTVNGSLGNRVMSGYTWSWWDYSYVSQGHNSAFYDEESRKAYLIYHNKFMDGTAFHVMKVHELLVNADGWLVTSPFEATIASTDISEADKLATNLTPEQIAGTYGVLFMTRNSGEYGSPVTEHEAIITASGQNGTITGTISTLPRNSWNNGVQQYADATFTYTSSTGAFQLRIDSQDQKGYLLWQNLEGTNIRTLAFTTMSTTSTGHKYTYWGYKYPTAAQQAEYFLDSLGFDGSATSIPHGEHTATLWDKLTFNFSYADGVLTVKEGENAIATYPVSDPTYSTQEKSVTLGNWQTPLDYYTLTSGGSITMTGQISAPSAEYHGIYAIIYPSNETDFRYILRPDCPVKVPAEGEWLYWENSDFVWYNTPDWSAGSEQLKNYCASGGGSVTWEFTLVNGTLRAEITFTSVNGTGDYNCYYTLENYETVQIGFGTDGVTASDVNVEYSVAEGYYAVTEENAVINQSWTAGASAEIYDGTTVTLEATIKGSALWHGLFGDVSINNDFYRFRVDNYVYTYSGANSNKDADLVRKTGEIYDSATYIAAINTDQGARQVISINYMNGVLIYKIATYRPTDTARTSPVTNVVYIVNVEGKPDAVSVDFYIDGATLVAGTQPVLTYYSEHVYQKIVAQTAPTACTEGITTYSCSCGEQHTEKDFTGVVGHQYGKSNVAATCTEGAKSIYTCSVCRDSFTVITAPALGHNWSAWGVTTQPTLEGTGQLTRTCSRDGAHAETFTLPALSETNYTYSATAATCTAAGTGTYTYGKDGQSFQFTVTIPALGHDWGTPEYNGTVLSVSCERADCGSKVTANLTFSAGEGSGSVTKIAATFDGKDFLVTLPGRGMEAAAEGMLFVGWTYEENTYSLNEQVTLAGGGNYTFTARYELHNHTYTPVEGSAATCTEAGIKAHYTCTCGRLFTADGETYTEVMQEDLLIPATGHTEEKIPAVAATCTEAGSTAGVKCSVCGEILEKPVTIPATGHTEEEIPAVAATCTTAGSTAGVECSVCGEILEEPETIAALGHSWDEGTVTTEPTCTETGIRTFTCARGCGETKTESVPAAGHSYGNWSVKTAPTAETAGVLVRVCEVCDGEETSDIPILNADDYTVTTINATCAAEGSATYTYAKDGQEIDVAVVSIPKTAHSWGEWRVTKQPTYTEAGQETRTCSVCNDTETRAVAALGLAQKFVDEVAAVAEATDRQSQFEAISAALTTYAQLSAEEKTEVASTYAVLETAIGAYNEAAEDVNGEMLSAMEIALITISSAAAAMGALAAVWLVVKKLI